MFARFGSRAPRALLLSAIATAFVFTGCKTAEPAPDNSGLEDSDDSYGRTQPSDAASSNTASSNTASSSTASTKVAERETPPRTSNGNPPLEARSLPTKPAKTTAAPVAVGDDVKPDPEIVALLAPRAAIVRERANRVVGNLSGEMKRGKPESALGNFVTDAMRTGTEAVAGTKVEVCFTNSGGLRTDLAAGEITEGMVVELMPFDNAIVILQMDGNRLRKLANHLAQRGDPVSGISYVRKGRKAKDIKIAGRPLEGKRRYTVCTNDYVYEGGSNYGLDDVKDAHYTGILIRDAILQAFESAHAKGKTIHPIVDGRASNG